jgi:hypothetical protein
MFIFLQVLTGVRLGTTATRMQTASQDYSATLATVDQAIRLVVRTLPILLPL